MAGGILAGMKFFAFCGIGNPRSFFATLERLGARLVAARDMGDHCEYTPRVLGRLVEEAGKVHAERLITTEKDYVKLAAAELPLPLWRLVVAMEVLEGRQQLVEKIRQTARVATAKVTVGTHAGGGKPGDT